MIGNKTTYILIFIFSIANIIFSWNDIIYARVTIIFYTIGLLYSYGCLINIENKKM